MKLIRILMVGVVASLVALGASSAAGAHGSDESWEADLSMRSPASQPAVLAGRPSATVTIPVGDDPQDVATNPAGTQVYVANGRSNSVSVVSTANNRVAATISLPSSPRRIVFDARGARAYVTGDGSTSVIDTARQSVTATLSVPGTGLAVNSSGSLLYVLTPRPSTLTVVETSTFRTVSAHPQPASSSALAVNPRRPLLYVSTSPMGRGSVTALSAATFQPSVAVRVGRSPDNLAVSPSGSHVYVSNYLSNSVSVVLARTTKVEASIRVNFYPRGLVVSPDGKRLYVLTIPSERPTSGELQVVDCRTNRVVRTIALPVIAERIALAPDGSTAYVTGALNDSVAVVSLS